jgi:hypothetical protein
MSANASLTTFTMSATEPSLAVALAQKRLVAMLEKVDLHGTARARRALEREMSQAELALFVQSLRRDLAAQHGAHTGFYVDRCLQGLDLVAPVISAQPVTVHPTPPSANDPLFSVRNCVIEWAALTGTAADKLRAAANSAATLDDLRNVARALSKVLHITKGEAESRRFVLAFKQLAGG